MTVPWLRLSTRVAYFLGVTLPEETDFEVGVEAWGRGDYDTAIREFQPLAGKGNTEALIEPWDYVFPGLGCSVGLRPGICVVTLAASQSPTAIRPKYGRYGEG